MNTLHRRIFSLFCVSICLFTIPGHGFDQMQQELVESLDLCDKYQTKRAHCIARLYELAYGLESFLEYELENFENTSKRNTPRPTLEQYFQWLREQQQRSMN